ncbi:hypothetical protein H0H81_011131 [Sphagnurus paluster]|uniref:Uncharacterized protein n=1 Tax=Sphagnurus paluster TaxID=117069 RepID=A0A9P7GN69_9AGAR|nr:hypothetical protein H0H81_011131 [Sphagnurus paluster]
MNKVADDGWRWAEKRLDKETEVVRQMRDKRLAEYDLYMLDPSSALNLPPRITRRFEALGYTGEDLEVLTDLPGIRIGDALTDADWEILKKRYLPGVDKIATQRMAHERALLIKRRTKDFSVSYKQWITTQIAHGIMTISEWRLLPVVGELLKSEAFLSKVEADSSLSVDFSTMSDQFATSTSSWRTRRLEQMLASLPLDSKSGRSPKLSDTERLSRAIAVFFCSDAGCLKLGSGPLVGYKAVLSHGEEHTEIKFSCEGAAVVRALLPLFGVKDPERCVPAELDNMDLRFWCLRCDKQPFKTRLGTHKGRRIYTWRDCVSGSFVFLLFRSV